NHRRRLRRGHVHVRICFHQNVALTTGPQRDVVSAAATPAASTSTSELSATPSVMMTGWPHSSPPCTVIAANAAATSLRALLTRGLFVCVARFFASAALCRYMSERGDMQGRHA